MAQSLLTECFGDEAAVPRIIFIIKSRAQRRVAGTRSSRLLRPLPSARAAPVRGLPPGPSSQQSFLLHRSQPRPDLLWAQLFCALSAAAPVSVRPSSGSLSPAVPSLFPKDARGRLTPRRGEQRARCSAQRRDGCGKKSLPDR